MLYFDQTNPYAQSLTFSDGSFILFICKVLYIVLHHNLCLYFYL